VTADVVCGPDAAPVMLRINGVSRTVLVEPRHTLLEALRLDLGLTGAKEVCDHGQCGACTVLLDGRAVYACLTLAVAVEGQGVSTIEGIGGPGELHPVQRAFIEHDAFQCGYCTPGQIMSLVALLDRIPNPTEDEVRGAVAGNLCRCGAYPNIVRAGLAAAAAMRARSSTRSQRRLVRIPSPRGAGVRGRGAVPPHPNLPPPGGKEQSTSSPPPFAG